MVTWANRKLVPDRHFSLHLKPFRDRIGKELLKRLAQRRTGREIASKLQTLGESSALARCLAASRRCFLRHGRSWHVPD